MEIRREVVKCVENELLAEYLLGKRQEIVDSPKGISENIDMTLQKAYSSICNSKTHITTLKEFSKIKGVGKWILRLAQGFFQNTSNASENEDMTRKGKENKGTRRYMPQKNSVAYALLIALYRGTASSVDYMRKQDLIDAAEASGLSRAPIMPEKGKGKLGQFGSSPREWYSGWSCMKTLVTKGLVVKSSCPAKYMLTEEGKKAARECLSRSGLAHSVDSVATLERSLNLDEHNQTDQEFSHTNSMTETTTHVSVEHKKPVEVPPESLNRFLNMGYSKEQILLAFSDALESSPNKNMSSLWHAVLCHLREAEVYGPRLESQNNLRDDRRPLPATYNFRDDSCSGQVDPHINTNRPTCPVRGGETCISKSKFHPNSSQIDLSMRACSTTDNQMNKQHRDDRQAESNVLTVPPLSFGERFEDTYDVVLILDDREKFTMQGSKSRKIVENISTQFKIEIEIRRLPVGDAIWVARHKYFRSEYVLDLIIERKKVDDLRSSIRDNRYRDQKVRLLVLDLTVLCSQ